MLKAFILAAGEGSRFAPYSRLVEKSMMPLGGKPVVRIIAENMYYQFAFDKASLFICVLKKHADAFRHEFRDMPVNIHPFDEPVGTLRSFSFAASQYSMDRDDDILLHYADTYTRINYNTMYQQFRKSGKPAMIAITNNIHHDYSEVMCDTDTNEVVKIHEKPLLTWPTWTGIAIFNYGHFLDSAFRDSTFADFGYDLLPKWASEHKLSAYIMAEPYYDVGNPRAYESIRDTFATASTR